MKTKTTGLKKKRSLLKFFSSKKPHAIKAVSTAGDARVAIGSVTVVVQPPSAKDIKRNIKAGQAALQRVRGRPQEKRDHTGKYRHQADLLLRSF